MILAPDGGKLTKRHGATVGGRLPRARLPAPGDRQLPGAAHLVARRGRGARHRPARRRASSSRRCRPSPAIFDLAKLDWLDHEYIMALAPEEHERLFARAAAGRDAAAGRRPRSRPPSSRRWCATARRRRSRRQVLDAAAAAAGPARRCARRRRPRSRTFRALRARGAGAGSRPPPPATCSPPTAPGARSAASAPATCSCRCASRSPAASTAPSCPSCSPRSTATRPPSRARPCASPGTLPVSPRRHQGDQP